MSCDAGWSSAACTKCVGQGSIPAADGFDTCPQCGGAGKVRTRSACCARHDDDAEIGPGGGHGHGHGHEGGHGHGHGGGAGTVFGAIGPPGSTLPGFTGTIPASLEELFATLELVDVKGDRVVAKEAFENKVVGVYFSASHCPACVRFSPTLDAFTERNAADYVTVLVPGDKDEQSAARYHKTLGANFLSVPFGSIHRTLLMTAYSVYAIPALHVWHFADAKHVTAWGHTAVTRAPETCVRDWHAGEQGWSWLDIAGVPKSWRCVAVAPRAVRTPLLAAEGGGAAEA